MGDIDISAMGDALAGALNGGITAVEGASVEAVVEPPVAEVTATGGHPAWGEVLSNIPEMLHDKVRPTLEAWDKGVEARLGQVHSQYAAYDPYKPLIERGVPLTDIEAGLTLTQAINRDPVAFFKQFAEHFGVGNSGQGQQPVVDVGEFEDEVPVEDPRISQLQARQEAFEAAFAARQEAETQAAADKWITEKQVEVTSKIKADLGVDITAQDMQFILTTAAQESSKPNVTPDMGIQTGVQAYTALVQRFRPSANDNAPMVVPSGGSVPATVQTPINKMSDKDRKTLGAQMLAQAFRP